MNLSETIFPGCKINLRLKVTAKRQDGYHEIDTLFLPLPFPADKLTFTESDTSGIALSCPQLPDCPAKNNLVVKAAGLYAEKAGITPAWKFVLEKRIPSAAGLGGGSSDAAGVLELLNKCYKKFTGDELAEMALKIGADVPFFLKHRPARATGVGEKFEYLSSDARFPEILIVFPGFPISAKFAYCALDRDTITPDAPEMQQLISDAAADPANGDWKKIVHNDLAIALYRKFPLLSTLRCFLNGHGALAAEVSGSGSSLFALFKDRNAAVEAGKALRASIWNSSVMKIFTGDTEL